jgi:hypothetical protein
MCNLKLVWGLKGTYEGWVMVWGTALGDMYIG